MNSLQTMEFLLILNVCTADRFPLKM